MLVGNTIHGTANGTIKNRARDFIYWLAEESDAVDAMLRSRDVLLSVNVLNDDNTGDQETVVEWRAPNTEITLTVNYRAVPALALEGDLLHELILHAEPATRKHIMAVTVGKAPAHATDDNDIEQEEKAEHADVNGWYRAGVLALLKSKDLLEQVVADTASHGKSVATELLVMLLNVQKIDAEYAKELQEELVNPDGGRDSMSDGEDK